MSSDPSCSFAVGIDVGAETCSCAILHRDKSRCGKPFSFPNDASGFALLDDKLSALAATPAQIWLGLEATSLYWENLYYHLHKRGYKLLLLHPAQTHHFAQRRGLRAKTDQLDANTIALLLLSGDARPAYLPSEEIAGYREIVRLMSRLTKEAASYKMEIRTLLQVLFPEFTTVFKQPHGAAAGSLLKSFPSAAAFVEAGVDKVAVRLREVAPRRYGRQTAQQLVALAGQSVSSGVARAARERSLIIELEQLALVNKHLAALQQELDKLMKNDAGAASLNSVPEFGPKTVAVLRAELGDVRRFAQAEQLVAYAGLDPSVRESGKWRGVRKISKRGSGAVRRILYLAAMRSSWTAGSAFGSYYQHLLEQGLAKMSALMAVMRKMLLVVYGLLKSAGRYDPTRVWAGARQQPEPTQEARAAA